MLREELLRMPLSQALSENEARFKLLLNAGINADAQFRVFTAGDTRLCVIYMEGMANDAKISEFILCACAEAPAAQGGAMTAESLMVRVMQSAQCERETRAKTILESIVTGMTAVLVDGDAEALLLETRGYPARPVGRTGNESVVIGAQEGFVESLRTNMTLLRRYAPSPALVMETLTVGRDIPCHLALAYLDGITSPDIVSALRQRVQKIDAPTVQGLGAIQQRIEDRPGALLPQMLQTERPDRAAACLAEGQAVLLADNSPFALVAPVTVFHQLHASDDSFARWQYGTFLRLVRVAGMLVSVFLPGMYIALTRYHAHLIPMSLLTSIAEARANVPFPVLVEILMMEFSFWLINEAGTRMPQQIGSALGIVGALILGQAAVSANIISPILIIIVALTGLGNYAVPDYGFSLGLVLYRLFILLSSAMLGLYGVCIAAFCVLASICGTRSLGFPYAAPVAPPKPHNPDLLLRLPVWLQKRRLYTAAQSQSNEVKQP